MSDQNTVQTLTEEIDGVTFSTTTFSALSALGLLAVLTKHVGPVLSVMGSMDPDTDLASAANAELIARTLGPALGALGPDIAQKLVLDILISSAAIIDGKAIGFVGKHASSNFNLVFTGRLKTMFKVVAWVLRSNYADFWSGGEKPPSEAETVAAEAAATVE